MSQNVFVAPYSYSSVPASYLESGALMWDSTPAPAMNSPAPLQQPTFLPSSSMVFMNNPAAPYGFPKVNTQAPIPTLPAQNGMFVLVNPQQPQPQPQPQQMMMLFPAVQRSPALAALPREVPKGAETHNICRHYLVGRCNRRKCRFLHPAIEPVPLPVSEQRAVPISERPLPLKESYDSSINRSSINDISASSSPLNSKSEMFFSTSGADSVLMDVFCRKA